MLHLRWKSRDGRVTALRDMGDSHLRNCINFLLEKPLGSPKVERLRTIYLYAMMEQLQANTSAAREQRVWAEAMEALAEDSSWGDSQ